MNRYVAFLAAALVLSMAPCHAQFLKKLEQELMGGQQQGQQQQQQMPGQPTMVGNVNLPPGQYMMTNTQSGQAFYVTVQNGQMYMVNGAPAQAAPIGGAYNGTMPGSQFPQQQQQQGGLGGMVKNGLGGFLKNELAPQQQAPVQGGY